MLKSLKYITSVCLLSSAIFCGAAETVKEATGESSQILLAQSGLKALFTQTMQDNPHYPRLLALYTQGSSELSEAIVDSIIIKKLTEIEKRLQHLSDIKQEKETTINSTKFNVTELQETLHNDPNVLFLMHFNQQGVSKMRQATIAAIVLEKLAQIEKRLS